MSDLTEKELEQAAKEYPSWLAPDTFGRLVAEVRRLRAFNHDAVLDDLHDLVRALGLPDVARPESPHEVMRQCIDEVTRLRAALKLHHETMVDKAAEMLTDRVLASFQSPGELHAALRKSPGLGPAPPRSAVRKSDEPPHAPDCACPDCGYGL